MTQFPPIDVTLPWMIREGEPTTVPLLLTTRERKALNRNYFNTYLWRPALERCGIPDERENGCHALRHFFASTALHEGETIKAVSEYLGHADPGYPSDLHPPDGGQFGAHQAGHQFGVPGHRRRRSAR